MALRLTFSPTGRKQSPRKREKEKEKEKAAHKSSQLELVAHQLR